MSIYRVRSVENTLVPARSGPGGGFSQRHGAFVSEARLSKRATRHTFRHSFTTHLVEDQFDIRTVQELPGHKSVRTTMADTHALNRGGLTVRSPADFVPINVLGGPDY
jgi:integrase